MNLKSICCALCLFIVGTSQAQTDFTHAGKNYQIYQLNGVSWADAQADAIASAPIPTMSEWGLVIFGLLLLNR